MPAYAVLDLSIFDKEKLQDYKNIAPGIIKKFGGEIIVRGGEINTMEGGWTPERIVVIKFPSYKVANDWWHSDEYTKAIKLRKKGAKTNLIIVDGIAEGEGG